MPFGCPNLMERGVEGGGVKETVLPLVLRLAHPSPPTTGERKRVERRELLLLLLMEMAISTLGRGLAMVVFITLSHGSTAEKRPHSVFELTRSLQQAATTTFTAPVQGLVDSWSTDPELILAAKALNGGHFDVLSSMANNSDLEIIWSNTTALRVMLDSMPMLKGIPGIEAISNKEDLTPDDVRTF